MQDHNPSRKEVISCVLTLPISLLPIPTRRFRSVSRFPKDTADEQIAALSDEGYVTAHFWFHNALIACLVLTAFSLPKAEGGEKKA